jgi:hypothetical protein
LPDFSYGLALMIQNASGRLRLCPKTLTGFRKIVKPTTTHYAVSLKNSPGKATAMKTSLTTRLIAAIISVGVTIALFSAVISPAMQRQADGSVRLAHAVVNTPSLPAATLIAQTSTSASR